MFFSSKPLRRARIFRIRINSEYPSDLDRVHFRKRFPAIRKYRIRRVYSRRVYLLSAFVIATFSRQTSAAAIRSWLTPRCRTISASVRRLCVLKRYNSVRKMNLNPSPYTHIKSYRFSVFFIFNWTPSLCESRADTKRSPKRRF